MTEEENRVLHRSKPQLQIRRFAQQEATHSTGLWLIDGSARTGNGCASASEDSD